jgi:peptidoglycan/xylan/chitin deacetylase (PgdA/CDA1 family)
MAIALTLVLVACGGSSDAVARHPAVSSPSAVAAGAGGGVGVADSPSLSPPASSPSPSPSAASPSATQSPDRRPVPPKPRRPGQASGTDQGPFGTATTTGSSAVALTFDDGPAGNTAQVLDLLKRYGIHATFCVIGSQVAGYPDLIRRIVNEGHTLCNHTWTHDLALRIRSRAQITAELQQTNDAIHRIVPNAPIVYFRNPGANFSPLTISVAASMGMKSIYWAVDPRDWSRPGTQAIINNVVGNTGPGSIVLMHDGGGDRSQTVQALQTILPNFKSRFSLIPLSTS